MLKLFHKTSDKAGLPPGSLIHVGEKRVEQTRITIIDYDETELKEFTAKSVEECLSSKDSQTVTWINIDGLHDTDIIQDIGNNFGIHSLVQEDILHTAQRPKLENLDDYIFATLDMIDFDEESGEVSTEQVSLILGRNFVISFQERAGDTFDFVRNRIRNGRGRIRRMGADYLFYALIDSIVDNYFYILERYGEKLELVEMELTENATIETLHVIHRLKKEMTILRKSVWPMRDVISGMEREETPLISESIRVFIRDLYDHTIQVIDSVDTMREIISGLQDLYLSSVSNRMNEVMKVLTIFASIFIPLTFVAGIYGMNFEYMPELKLRWAYPALWIIMISMVGVLLVLFRRNKWL
ncbi:MAG: magnesium/cobalt transporter CorA [Deltaproteobacteria bacterium]|nr:magnesium/cobalt transporter CorA [Deltaproteobacteria bacterium]